MSELEPRGPGRPRKYETVAPTDIQASNVPKRPKRKPFGSLNQKLAYPPRENYHRHWFNDTPGRVQRAQEAGYEHVKDKDGKNVSMIVGTAEGGGPLVGFLMEIPEEWYQQDMAEQQAERDKLENQIKQGKLESKEGDGRYIPSQGIKIERGK